MSWELYDPEKGKKSYWPIRRISIIAMPTDGISIKLIRVVRLYHNR